MLWVAFGWSCKAVFLGCQDISPSVVERIPFGLKPLLLPFQAPRGCDELFLKAFLLEGFFWHDEVFVARLISSSEGGI